ncbi:MAG: serine hydrolase [Bacteroidetes bacterium]|nr:serine hydrolase [Bacteroidota bacterium]
MGAAAIMRSDSLIYHGAWGYANIEDSVPADSGTVYRIGSVSKTFTAVMAMQMMEAGLLAPDDKLARFFPQLDGADRITIDHMLRHRSGLFSLTSDSAYTEFYTKAHSRRQLLERIATYRLQFEPGSRMEYSNTNYLLLGWLLEDLSGLSFAELLQRRIAKPLGLKYTFAEAPHHGIAARSYSPEGQAWKLEEATHMSIPGGAGNICSTPQELLVFYHALFSGRLISAQSLAQMTDLQDNFGYGLFFMPFYDLRGYGHTGGIDGFRSVAVYFPESRTGAAICSNALNYNQNEILIAMLSHAFGRKWQLPVFDQIEVSEQVLESYVGTYAADGFPLKLTIRHRNGRLFGQGTGQPEFPFEARSESTFVFDAAGLSITFSDGKLFLRQGGLRLEMSREP